VIRAARPGARRLAQLVFALGVAGGIALGIIGCVQGVGDADKYGRVTLPGEDVVDLPEGEIALYYEERVTLSDNDSLDAPDGIRVVAVRENERIKSKKRGLSNAISLDGRALDEWGKIEIPRAGKWRIVTRSRESGSNQPAVTLGRGQTDNLVDAGTTAGTVMAAGLGAALLILLLGRIGYTRPTPQQLVAAMPRLPEAYGGSAPAWSPSPGSAPGGAMPGGSAPPTGSPPAWSPPPGIMAAPASPPAPAAASGDPVEVQLRDLERRHAAGEFDEPEYKRRRQAVLDAAFRRPGG
jgi:hypothetical protein